MIDLQRLKRQTSEGDQEAARALMQAHIRRGEHLRALAVWLVADQPACRAWWLVYHALGHSLLSLEVGRRMPGSPSYEDTERAVMERCPWGRCAVGALRSGITSTNAVHVLRGDSVLYAWQCWSAEAFKYDKNIKNAQARWDEMVGRSLCDLMREFERLALHACPQRAEMIREDADLRALTRE